jgi:hypothetical protein
MKHLILLIGFLGNDTSQQPKVDPAAVEKLKELKKLVLKADPDIPKWLGHVKETSKQISDKQLPGLEHYVLRSKDKALQSVAFHLFIHRSRFDTAAKLIVLTMGNEKNPSYVVWKTWEYCYGERKDYMTLSKHFGEALLRQFEKGDKKTKLTVAMIFSKGEAESKLSTKEFRKLIFRNEKKKGVKKK